MHPIVLLLIAGTGAYFLYDAMEDETPEVQSLPNKNGDTVVVPTKGHHRRPKESLTDVPPPPENGPQAIHDPPPYRPGPQVNVRAPVLVSKNGAATNLAMQSVEDIQRALNALGFGPLAVTGRVSPATQRAIAAFQREFGLPQTGTPDFSTRKKTEMALAKKANAGSQIASQLPVQQATPESVAHLAQSASQLPVSDVTSMQRALNALGANPPLKLDGILGKKTTAAIKAFQIASGLVADGVPGPKTLTALQAAVDPKSNATVYA
jgi:peptidoglycan hydrolase-like protein with peptidoglycan-binding domain